MPAPTTPEVTDPAPAPGGGGPGDDSMALLRALVEDSLDDGYARAAARRPQDGTRAARPALLLTVGLLAVGLLLATAFAQARDRSGAAAEARRALVAEVETREAANSRDQADLDLLRAAVARTQRGALDLTGAGSALATRLSTLEAVTGTGPVSGPGLVLRLDDAPVSGAEGPVDVDPRTAAAGEGRVTDRDLQTVVNEIWAAGAEAIAVNGQRLTALSAIRSAGAAVLVDFRPLRPPYVVRALGDPATLRGSFVDGFGGSYLAVLTDFGIAFTIEDADRIRLPASAGVTLRYAGVPSAIDDEGDTGAADGKGPR